ncbi:MAG: carbohydrate ABC transporter permease [Bifidobacterium sp.]|uniref:Carbohydrate ABC transporter permease n=1 Tax=Bifidobacterium fermentum TaxID=3059035 RepID=A0AB39UB07_9BIFI
MSTTGKTQTGTLKTPYSRHRTTGASSKVARSQRVGKTPWLMYFFVACILILFIFPLLYLLNTALKSTSEFVTNPVGIVSSFQWGNFAEAWSKGNFGAYFLNTVIYTVCGAGLGTAISLFMGFPVARGYIKGSKFWSLLFTLVLFLPNALMTQFQLLLRLHLYNTQIGYILMVAVGVGIGPLLFTGFVSSIPKDLDEAAAIDGAGYWTYLFKFIVPLSKPALMTVFILQAVWIWNEIIMATVLFSDQNKFPISAGLFAFKGTYSNNWPLLAAATIIVAAPLVLGYLFIQRYLVNGVLGAVKG